MPTEAVHVALEEKIMMTVRTTTDIGLSGPYFCLLISCHDNETAQVGRDGGLQGLEVLGFLTLRVADESLGRIR